MLPGTLGRQFNDDQMRIDLPDLCQRSGAKLIMADTAGLDLQTSELRFNDHEPVDFDALSVGVGSMPAGWDAHKDAKSLVPIKPMQTFLQRLSYQLDQCREPRHKTKSKDLVNRHATKIAIVGGGVASVEIALCLYQMCQQQSASRNFEIKIFTSSDTVASGMKPKSIAAIKRILKSRNIQIIPGHRVDQVGDDFVGTDDANRHDADVVIWATGAVAPPVLAKLGLETDDQGFIATTKTLQSISDPRIFAVGDSGTILESPSPKAGVYAVRQCPVLWHNLQAFFDGSPMKSFEPQSDFLKLLNTGDGKALLQYGFVTTHARWCWYLKTWIDRKFIIEFKKR